MMIFNAIKDAAQKTFVYSGRSERLEHWAFTFFSAWCSVMVMIVHKFFGGINVFPVNWIVLGLTTWLILANVSLMVRRLHDHNFSGFLLFLPLLSISVWLFGFDQYIKTGESWLSEDVALTMISAGKWSLVSSSIVFLSFFARPGDKNDNKYGAAV